MEFDHHAYVYYGSDISVLPTALQHPGADIEHLQVDRWGIHDSRRLANMAAQRPVAKDKRVFVVLTKVVTHEAQNALLKLLEDPPPTAVFILVVPSVDRLIDTICSRVVVANLAPETVADEAWQQLRALPLAEQLATIADRTKAKDTVWQQSVLTAAVHDTAIPRKTRQLIETYREEPGASRKMLLEEVVLSLASAQ
jgi:DNA polymerase III delta prime subunit